VVLAAALDARLSRAEVRVRDCMKAQGFDYVAVDPVAAKAALMAAGRCASRSGSSATSSPSCGAAAARATTRTAACAPPSTRPIAPRPTALGGEEPGATFQDAMDTGEFTRLGGCRRTAIEAVFGGAEVLTAIQGQLDELDERIVSDGRMVRATERWASCMAAAGYRYTDPDAIDVDLQQRIERIVGCAASSRHAERRRSPRRPRAAATPRRPQPARRSGRGRA
jgi:hypothetical protein